MEQDENNTLIKSSEIMDNLVQIKQYLEKDIIILRKENGGKSKEIEILKNELENVQHLVEGNRQLINKLLGELSKLENDIGWYKRTYEQRSLLGTMWEKVFRKRNKKLS